MNTTGCLRSWASKITISLEAYSRLVQNERVAGMAELFFMGRATYALKPYFPTYPAHAFFDMPCQPTFLRERHNHFDNYGSYIPGFCGGLSLGNWLELDTLLEEGIDLDNYPVLRFLVADDMEGLFHFAQDSGYPEAEQGHLSKCDLCLDIRRRLVTQGKFAELRPRQFYERLTPETTL